MVAHGMTCEGPDAQDFSTEDVGMLQNQVADMLKDGLHLEGVEVLKVERIKLRMRQGRLPLCAYGLPAKINVPVYYVLQVSSSTIQHLTRFICSQI